jgi:hypothetical protein
MLINIGRKAFTALIFALAFVINPAYVTGCGDSEEDGPYFGEAEMVALLDDFTAAAPTELEDGEAQYEVELSLVESDGADAVSRRGGSAFANTAFACGSRTFMKSASACDTMTRMLVEGTLTLTRVDGDQPVVIVESLPVEGFMTAESNYLKHVTIDLELEGGGTASWSTTNGMDFALDSFDAQDLGDDAVDVRFQ